MWAGRDYFMEKQPKANKQKKEKEKLYILSTTSEMRQEHRWTGDKMQVCPSTSLVGIGAYFPC